MSFIVHLAVAALLALLGAMFFGGKGASLIAGYNTATPQEKAATDEKSSAGTWAGSCSCWPDAL